MKKVILVITVAAAITARAQDQDAVQAQIKAGYAADEAAAAQQEAAAARKEARAAREAAEALLAEREEQRVREMQAAQIAEAQRQVLEQEQAQAALVAAQARAAAERKEKSEYAIAHPSAELQAQMNAQKQFELNQRSMAQRRPTETLELDSKTGDWVVRKLPMPPPESTKGEPQSPATTTPAKAVRLTKADVDKVAEGMSMEQVDSILGPPTYLDNKDFPVMRKTIYVYEQGKDTVKIVFKDFKVTESQLTLSK